MQNVNAASNYEAWAPAFHSGMPAFFIGADSVGRLASGNRANSFCKRCKNYLWFENLTLQMLQLSAIDARRFTTHLHVPGLQQCSPAWLWRVGP